MSLSLHTEAELHAEILRRKEAAKAGMRAELEQIRKREREIMAELSETGTGLTRAPRKKAEPVKYPAPADIISLLSGSEAPRTAKAVSDALGVTPKAAAASLAVLVTKGDVVKTGQFKGARYGLALNAMLVTG